ncbi:MAG: leucyl aminopeptidase family protein, partial [Pseudomonadota bacterium]
MTQALETVFASADEASASPISLSAVAAGQQAEIEGLDAQERGWVAANNFRGVAGSTLCLPAADGGIARALVGIGAPDDGDPCGSALLHLGRAPSSLPKGIYAFDPSVEDTETAAIAWGLGGYQFQRFKSKSAKRARLVVPDAVGSRVRAIVAAVHRGRDLINTPANALGPSELADAVVELGEQHGARVKIRKGEDVGFAEEFPLLHAVGRASTRPSRLCDLTWGDPQAPKITLVGKGIIFDTGGLDLKPAAAMLL